MNNNYPSVALHEEALLAELEEQTLAGWMVKMTLGEAQSKFGEVSIAPLAVLEEKPGQTRTLRDASNYVRISHQIHVRDQEQCPSALDIQAAMTAENDWGKPLLCLVLDVSKAQCRIPIAAEGWRHLGCSPFRSRT